MWLYKVPYDKMNTRNKEESAATITVRTKMKSFLSSFKSKSPQNGVHVHSNSVFAKCLTLSLPYDVRYPCI